MFMFVVTVCVIGAGGVGGIVGVIPIPGQETLSRTSHEPTHRSVEYAVFVKKLFGGVGIQLPIIPP